MSQACIAQLVQFSPTESSFSSPVHLCWRVVDTANRLPLSLVADFQGWVKITKGTTYGGAPILGVYAHPKVLSTDAFAVDRLIYPVHPFLPIWDEATKKKEGC